MLWDMALPGVVKYKCPIAVATSIWWKLRDFVIAAAYNSNKYFLITYHSPYQGRILAVNQKLSCEADPHNAV